MKSTTREFKLGKKHDNVTKNEEEELYVCMVRNKDSRSGKDDFYVESGSSRHFSNSIDWYVDLVENKFQYDCVF